jgi:glutathione S-transferase
MPGNCGWNWMGEEWVLGSRDSVADPYTLVIYGWGKGHGMPVEQLRNYTAFKDRMLQRPAVRGVLKREESRLLQG